MSNLQVKNIPAELHRKLRLYARREGRSLRDLVLEAVRRDLAHREFQDRLATRRPVELSRSAGRSLEAVRREREAELDR